MPRAHWPLARGPLGATDGVAKERYRGGRDTRVSKVDSRVCQSLKLGGDWPHWPFGPVAALELALRMESLDEDGSPERPTSDVGRALSLRFGWTGLVSVILSTALGSARAVMHVQPMADASRGRLRVEHRTADAEAMTATDARA